MSHLTDAMETALANYVGRGTAMPALTAPIRVQLLSALGTGDAAGTVVSGAILDFGANATTTDTTENATIRRYEGLANPTTVAGFRIIDSAATPVVVMDNIPRTGGSVSVTSGIFEIPAGGLDLTAA